MKKTAAAILCLILVFSLGASCFADSIYVPDNDFYNLNHGQCQIHDRRYVAAAGSCAQKTPVNSTLAFELKENFVYNVAVTYTDGKGVVWGCVEEDNKVMGKSGWLPLSSLSLVYDDISFTEEHGKEFSSGEGFSPDLSGGAVFFEYPSSPEKWVRGSGTGFSDISYADSWVDENGVTWLHVIYYYGMRGWICADNPLAGHDLANNTGSEGIVLDSSAPEIEGLLPCDKIILAPSSESPVPHVLSEETLPPPHVPDNNRMILIIALAITLVAAGAAVGLAFALKKKK